MILWLKWVLLIALAVLVSAAGLWVAEHQGQVQIDWLGYRISASFWVMLVLALGIILAFLFISWGWMQGSYALAMRRGRKQMRRQQHGLDALTDIVVALTAQDYGSARTALTHSQKLMGRELPLNLLLQAQLAAKEENHAEMHQVLHSLSQHECTSFLALRSLSAIAEQEKDYRKALQLAKEAYAKAPEKQDIALRYLGALIRAEEWQEAEAVVASARRKHVFSKQAAQHYQAMLAVLQYQRTGEVAALQQALKKDRHFVPAFQLIDAWCRVGKERKALNLLFSLWKQTPHKMLTESLLQHFQEEQPQKLLKRVNVLLQSQPSHIESHLAMARAAFIAKQWELSRNHLKAALAIAPQQRVFQLLALLEEVGHHDEAAASAWLKRLADAEADPEWHCAACGTVHEAWHSHCPECGSFDSILWDVPRITPQQAATPLTAIAGL